MESEAMLHEGRGRIHLSTRVARRRPRLSVVVCFGLVLLGAVIVLSSVRPEREQTWVDDPILTFDEIEIRPDQEDRVSKMEERGSPSSIVSPSSSALGTDGLSWAEVNPRSIMPRLAEHSSTEAAMPGAVRVVPATHRSRGAWLTGTIEAWPVRYGQAAPGEESARPDSRRAMRADETVESRR